MWLLIIFLSFVLVLDSLFLILLVLMQPPRKEAGIGQAFGGSATDALFGAGSGTVVTKVTKYSAGVFLAMALLLSVLVTGQAKQRHKGIEEELRKRTTTGFSAPTGTNAFPGLSRAASNALQAVMPTNRPLLESTNQPATVTQLPAPATNKPPAAPTVPPK
jgi:protein translocase SecG subunit